MAAADRDYAADWVNDGRAPHGGTYVVRGPKGIVCETSPLRAGWDRAQDLAAAMNTRAEDGTPGPKSPLTLAEVRRSQGVTQAELAAFLGHHRQSQVSRTERQSDLLASTLRSYVEALGGRLELVAEFPDEATFILTPFSSQPPSGGSQTDE